MRAVMNPDDQLGLPPITAAEAWRGILELALDPGSGGGNPSERRWSPEALAVFELHREHACCARARGCAIAMLGQSLDGFIATRAGHSRYINGADSLVHLHRLRALSDAVLIGVGTALADAPRLTTRHVPGPHATRVVIDPRGRLPATSSLIRDGAAPTILLRAGAGPAGETRLSDQAIAVDLPARDGTIAPETVVGALRRRGLTRLLLEGGGITVARFLDAGLLDRLQLAVSPLILGAGRPALPVAAAERLDQGRRPDCRHHLLGGDVLFDLRFPSAPDAG